jgi:hypothetical protein
MRTGSSIRRTPDSSAAGFLETDEDHLELIERDGFVRNRLVDLFPGDVTALAAQRRQVGDALVNGLGHRLRADRGHGRDRPCVFNQASIFH